MLAANLAWTTLCLGGYRAETQVVTFAATGLLLLVHFVARAFGATPMASSGSAAAFLPFLAYAAVNVAIVSPVPWLGWLDWLGWANFAATYFVVRCSLTGPGPRRLLLGTLVGLGVVAVGLGCYQRFSQPDWLMLGRTQVPQFIGRSSGSFGIPNSLAGFLLLVLPLTAWAGFRRGATAVQRIGALWVTGVLSIGLFLTLSRGAWFALAIAWCAWPWTVRRWTRRRRAAISAAVFLGLAGIAGATYFSSAGARDRLDQLRHHAGELSRPTLWRAAWNLFVSRPLTGTGGGSYNVLFERHRPAGFVDEPQWAHNDYLNTLSDYGVVGAGLLVLGAGWVLRRKGEARGGTERAGASRALGIGVLAFGLQLFVEFHLRIPALAMALAVVTALAFSPASAGERPDSAETRRRSRRLGWAGGLIVVLACGPALEATHAEALRRAGREAIDRAIAGDSLSSGATLASLEAGLARATLFYPGHGQAWADRALAIELQALGDPSLSAERGRQAERAARRALDISSAVPEFWIRLGVALDMQRRSSEARPAYEHACSLAPKRSQVWYYYAYHLSREANGTDAALGAVATCLSLDPGNRAAEALRAKLIVRPKGVPSVP